MPIAFEIPMAGARLVSLPIYRRSFALGTAGERTATWTVSHTLTSIEIQQVSAASRLRMEGRDKEIVYKCFARGDGLDILDGDRVKDPLAGAAPSDPDLEVYGLQQWPAVDGLPGHTEFFLKKIGQ